MAKMKRFFNTAGPCVPGDHYMIDQSERFDDIDKLIDNKHYFVLHAPRQTGKTTAILQLADKINNEGKYIALYANVEVGQAWRNNIVELNKTIINELRMSAKVYLAKKYCPSPECYGSEVHDFSTFLINWCLELPKPLILFIDEVDSLIGDGLISVLRQLRSGYTKRPKAFPHALCMIGLRDIRDYRIYSDKSKKYIIGGSCFNIKKESLRIKDFSKAQVKQLFQQHTNDTGQQITPEALESLYYYSQGQPWLVNALGGEICFGRHAIPDSKTIQPEHVKNAVEILIKRCDVHLDQLADKLTEPRVSRVIEAILTGEQAQIENTTSEDRQYLLDLGLIRLGKQGLEIANPIYREIIPRELTVVLQDAVVQNPAWYIKKDGKLDINKVLQSYVEFYKENSEMVTRRKTYTEAAHHLLFMAWLQRIVNGGGIITREYAAGLKRLDLCIEFAGERFAFELKLSSPKALDQGRRQLAEYLDRLSLNSGWLIIFTRGMVTDWQKVGECRTLTEGNKQIEVINL